MKANKILDPLNEVHVLALQLVFLERINTTLPDFIVYWIDTSLEQSISKLLINTG